MVGDLPPRRGAVPGRMLSPSLWGADPAWGAAPSRTVPKCHQALSPGHRTVCAQALCRVTGCCHAREPSRRHCRAELGHWGLVPGSLAGCPCSCCPRVSRALSPRHSGVDPQSPGCCPCSEPCPRSPGPWALSLGALPASLGIVLARGLLPRSLGPCPQGYGALSLHSLGLGLRSADSGSPGPCPRVTEALSPRLCPCSGPHPQVSRCHWATSPRRAQPRARRVPVPALARGSPAAW